MGNTSKELAEIKKKNEVEFPVENVDYYVQRYLAYTPIMSGYITYTTVNKPTKAVILKALADPQPKKGVVFPFKAYMVYPGPKPDKKWGKVCP